MNIQTNNLPALVWGVSGILIIAYAFLGLMGRNIPGIAYLINFLSELDNIYIYVALILAMLIEGTYIIGNFFPGSSIIILLVLGKTIQDTGIFIASILLIFFSWSFSGLINIGIGLLIKKSFHLQSKQTTVVTSNKWISWFPAFRANYEVSQIVEGAYWNQVLIVSTKIKIITSLYIMVILFLVSPIISVKNLSNKEGFITLFIIGFSSIIVSYLKYKRKYNAI